MFRPGAAYKSPPPSRGATPTSTLSTSPTLRRCSLGVWKRICGPRVSRHRRSTHTGYLGHATSTDPKGPSECTQPPAQTGQYALPDPCQDGRIPPSQETTQNNAPAGSPTHVAASRNRHSAFSCTGPSVRALGAKLGAIRCGRLRTAMDGYGQQTVSFRTVWTAADGYGRGASIYGSEGWGFEFLRACQ